MFEEDSFSTLHRDEDMQSLASLMSMKQSDIGNLDDFNDSDDEVGEERRASFGTGQATHVTGKTGHTLEEDSRVAVLQFIFGNLMIDTCILSILMTCHIERP